MSSTAFKLIDVMGMPIEAVTSADLLEHIAAACLEGRGGWVVTANLDILQHFCGRSDAREAYLAADLRIADGMPLLWAARAQGESLPERVTGSTFSMALVEVAAARGWELALLGGSPGTAERAATRLKTMFAGLRVSARSDLRFSEVPTPDQVQEALGSLPKNVRIVLVGLGSPKQEFAIRELRPSLPAAWFIGVGGTFDFLAGEQSRAPVALQRVGLEWAYRLAREPKRLAHRYLVRNLPFLFRVLGSSTLRRLRARGTGGRG
jgi:N-acetylglucosaminyldiphosphoundecaprenol N-acetyl-beta-D-mannosaminyltransferase